MSGCDTILLAAGRGERLGFSMAKAMVPLLGRPLFVHSLERFARHPLVERIVLVVPVDPADAADVRRVAGSAGVPWANKLVALVPGGQERQDSVRAGLEALGGLETSRQRIVLVHDAARPWVAAETIERCCLALEEGAGADAVSQLLPGIRNAPGPAGVVPGLPVRETLKLVYDGRVVMTQPRDQLYTVQTPQGFRFGPLREAHQRAHARGHLATDDAGLLEWLGMTVVVVPGDVRNVKITYPEDLAIVERMLSD